MTTALSLNGVTKRYGDFTAVQSLSFEVGTGQICGFLGPNGAGKTSTIRMILGLVEPTEGTIEVLSAKDARKVRERIGFLPEERGIYKRMTPIDAIAFFAGLKGVSDRDARRRAKQMLEEQGLGAAMNRPIKALSKGMSQKVQLLSAIAHDPELVILDEPFSGLDPVNQQSLETIIRGLASKGSTVLFSTHVMQHAERLCDRVVLMARGRKMFDGDLAQARKMIQEVPLSKQDTITTDSALDAAKAYFELGDLYASQHYIELMQSLLKEDDMLTETQRIMKNLEQKRHDELKIKIKQINNEASYAYQQGQYNRAVDLFGETFDHMPTNPTLALNILQSMSKGASFNELTSRYCRAAIKLLSKSELSNDNQNRFYKYLNAVISLYPELRPRNKPTDD